MSMFNKQKAQPVIKNKTHKKKNTYVIQMTCLASYGSFQSCQSTPLSVVTLNGQTVQDSGGWMSCEQFPNPCANIMATNFDTLTSKMGTKLASTIVRYLDKYTNEPVLTLFPQNDIYFHKTGMSGAVKITVEGEEVCLWLPRGTENEPMRLNHASRQDLFHQVMLRQKMLTK